MRLTGIIWLPDIVLKLVEKHNVEASEVAQILAGRPQFRRIERGHRSGEHVYAALGATEAGRRLIVFFVLKRDGRALVVSAREMTAAEKKLYEKR